MRTITLNNGVEMPQIGYGVFQVSPDEAERCVADALSVGYRMVDTAQAYQNEEGVGRAIQKSGIKREDLFVVDKIWFSQYAGDSATKSIEDSLRKLGTDYIDLMLLHQPYGDRYNAYRDLEEALKVGKVRAIGVSNFYSDHLIDLSNFMEVIPAVNQVETHMFFQQQEARQYMDELGVKHMSWGPLAEGKNNFFSNEVMKSIGENHRKSVAQVALRYLLQRDVIVIPKSVRKERMAENFDVFDFELSSEEMSVLAQLDTHEPVIIPSHHSAEVTKMFMGWSKPIER
ncbi:aldo/keto reductase [Ihuprevotella massiliensis]|uniref:aldo/keto reductase n=1 Tax=Ihuprevotella massiliensis TaxID=1852368 RepID=UPI00094DFF43